MRSKLYASLIVVALLSVVGWTQYAHGQRTSSMKQTWEYHVDPVPGTGVCDRQSYTAEVCDPIFARNAALDSRLINQRAAEGWELTAVGGTNYYFKRAR